MNIIKIAALTATLLAGASTAALAIPYNVMGSTTSLASIQEASNATVLKVTENEALSLSFDNNATYVQDSLKNNPRLLAVVESQGYSADQIVGVSGGQNSLTFYAR